MSKDSVSHIYDDIADLISVYLREYHLSVPSFAGLRKPHKLRSVTQFP